MKENFQACVLSMKINKRNKKKQFVLFLHGRMYPLCLKLIVF